jgi:hypothetical protein
LCDDCGGLLFLQPSPQELLPDFGVDDEEECGPQGHKPSKMQQTVLFGGGLMYGLWISERYWNYYYYLLFNKLKVLLRCRILKGKEDGPQVFVY